MLNQELLKYIEDAREQGYSKDEIRDTLLNVGWRLDDVKEAFHVIDESNDAKVLEAGSKKQKFIIFIGIIIVIFLFGSSAFGGYYYYQTIPTRALKKAQENLGHIESVKYKIDGDFSWEIKEDETTLNFSVDAQGAFDEIDKEDIKSYCDVEASMKADIITENEIESIANDVDFSIAYKNVGGTFYFKADFPDIISVMIPFELSFANGDWVEFEEKDFEKIADGAIDVDIEKLQQPNNNIWEKLQEYNLLEAEYIKNEEINGVEARRLSFSVREDELIRFFEEEYGEEYMNSEDGIDSLNALKEVKGECWIGKKDGFIYRLDINTISIRDVSAGSISIKAEFSDFNKPINVTAPVDAVKQGGLGDIPSS